MRQLGEAAGALVALVGPLAGMRQHVTLQRARVRKGFRAGRAFVGTFARVDLEIQSKTSLLIYLILNDLRHFYYGSLNSKLSF